MRKQTQASKINKINKERISFFSAKLLCKLLGFNEDVFKVFKPLCRGIFCANFPDGTIISDEFIENIAESICICFGAPELKTDRFVKDCLNWIIRSQKIFNHQYVGMPQMCSNNSNSTFIVIHEREFGNIKLILLDKHDCKVDGNLIDQVNDAIRKVFNMQLKEHRSITWVELFRMFSFPGWRHHIVNMALSEAGEACVRAIPSSARLTIKRSKARSTYVKTHVEWVKTNLLKCDADQSDADKEVFISQNQDESDNEAAGCKRQRPSNPVGVSYEDATTPTKLQEDSEGECESEDEEEYYSDESDEGSSSDDECESEEEEGCERPSTPSVVDSENADHNADEEVRNSQEHESAVYKDVSESPIATVDNDVRDANEEVLVTSSQEKQREDDCDQEAQEADQGNPYNQNHSPSNTVVEQDDAAGSKRCLGFLDNHYSPLKRLQHHPPEGGVSPSDIWSKNN